SPDVSSSDLRDLAAVAAVDRADLRVAVDFRHEAAAASAQDAAIAVEHQRRTEVDVGFQDLAVASAASPSTPSPSKGRRGKSMRLSSLPNAYEKSCSGHSPPLSQTGQSSGWLMRRNSNTPLRPSTASASCVCTTIPSAQIVEQAVCSFGIFSIFTRQTRHD